jgi:hypothetical protein
MEEGSVLLLASAATVAWLARVGGGREGPGDGSGSPPSPGSKRHLACRVASPGGAESPRPSHATRKKTSRQWASLDCIGSYGPTSLSSRGPAH